MATLFAIPQPPTVPFFANTPLMDREHPNETFKLLADQYRAGGYLAMYVICVYALKVKYSNQIRLACQKILLRSSVECCNSLRWFLIRRFDTFTRSCYFNWCKQLDHSQVRKLYRSTTNQHPDYPRRASSRPCRAHITDNDPRHSKHFCI